MEISFLIVCPFHSVSLRSSLSFYTLCITFPMSDKNESSDTSLCPHILYSSYFKFSMMYRITYGSNSVPDAIRIHGWLSKL